MEALRLLVVLLLPYFPPSVASWGDEVAHWSYRYELPPALVMTVMQLESCGNPTVTSGAGAAGLFQVMPYHFAEGEPRYDPMVNAHRGLSYLRMCHEAMSADPAMTLACYNGGLAGASFPVDGWSSETRRYVYWGSRLLRRAQRFEPADPIYRTWWEKRGRYVCDLALIVQSAGA